MRFIRDIIDNHQQQATVKKAPPPDSVDMAPLSPPSCKLDDTLEMSHGPSAWAAEDRGLDRLNQDATSLDDLEFGDEESLQPDLDQAVGHAKLLEITPELENRLETQSADTAYVMGDIDHSFEDITEPHATDDTATAAIEPQIDLPHSPHERSLSAIPSVDEQSELTLSEEPSTGGSEPKDEIQSAPHPSLSPAAVLQPRDENPAASLPTERSSRAKTRLLGFNTQPVTADPVARLMQSGKTQAELSFPVGWLVVVEGLGRGHSFQLFAGVAQIGRAGGQDIRIDFGDNAISRENHAVIAYDVEQNAFFLGHGGKTNIVRRNNRPVLSTEQLVAEDMIRIGETTLRFVPLCGPSFSWDAPQEAPQSLAGRG